jgi:ribosomal protein L14
MVDTKDNNQTSVAVVVQDIPTPVIVDLGSRKKKAIKRLKNGQGKLMAEVALAIEQVRSGLPEADQNNQVIPVVIIYKKKKKKRGGGMLSNPLNALSPFNFLR